MNNSDFDNYNNNIERELRSLVERLSEEVLERKQQSAYGQAIAEKNYISTKLKETLKELSDLKFALDKAAIVAITDRHGIITYVNKTFCEISQYSEEELIGKTHRVIKSDYHSREFFQELWRTIGTGKVWKGEVKNKAKDGSHYWVDTTIVPFLNDRGIPDRYLAIRFEIGDRKRAEEAQRESETKNRGLIDAIPDVMFRLNSEGIFLDYFPAKERKNARSPQEFIGKNIFEVFSQHLAERTMYYLGEALKMKVPQLHEYMLERGREWHPARSALCALRRK
jgi:PAS domain S-box-containing protein